MGRLLVVGEQDPQTVRIVVTGVHHDEERVLVDCCLPITTPWRVIEKSVGQHFTPGMWFGIPIAIIEIIYMGQSLRSLSERGIPVSLGELHSNGTFIRRLSLEDLKRPYEIRALLDPL